MKNVQPIPKELLIHSIIYKEFVKTGTFEKEYLPEEVIENVLVQPNTELKSSGNNEEVRTKAVIFLDRLNTPNFKALKPDSIVIFGGTECTVISCEALYDFHPLVPHHYEVTI